MTAVHLRAGSGSNAHERIRRDARLVAALAALIGLTAVLSAAALAVAMLLVAHAAAR